MNLFSFNSTFANELSCRTYLKDLRLKHGITCKVCESQTKHYWLERVGKFQCSVCSSRTNLKAGTMMENSRLPLRVWFMCVHLMTSTKKSLSALEMRKQLGLKFYEPVWYMMTKIRRTMGKRDKSYKLSGNVEMDDAFFEIVNLPEKDEVGKPIVTRLKRGRGSHNKMKVLVMVESNPVEQPKDYKKKRQMGYVKMVVMDNINSVGVNYEVQKALEPTATVLTDGYSAYSRLTDVVQEHQPMVVKPDEAMKKLPWVHTVISNAKRLFLGVHHSVNRKYLQSYIDEFVYKLNRRNFIHRDPFDGLMVAGVSDVWY